jgi:outer membrane protein
MSWSHRCIFAACAALSCAAGAQDLPLWEVGVLGGTASTPAYPGADSRSTRSLVAPFGIYRGEVFRADRSGIGMRLFESDRVELDVGLAASLPADSDEVDARAGMSDLGTLLEFGPRIKVALARPSANGRLRLDIPLRAVIEARGGLRNQGFTFEPRLVYELAGPGEVWTMDANLGAVLGERKVNRYFYEVQPQFATAARPAYQAESGLMLLRAGLSGTRMINRDLRLFGFLRYESYASAANRDSPLMDRKTGASAGFGFAWTIKRSARMAAKHD